MLGPIILNQIKDQRPKNVRSKQFLDKKFLGPLIAWVKNVTNIRKWSKIIPA